jgi:hypothetical protein
MVWLLEPIERMSKLFEGAQYATASLAVIRLIHMQQWIAGIETKTSAGGTFKRWLLHHVGKLFGEQAAANLTLHKAAFFDPRVKTLWWLTDPKSGANNQSIALYNQIVDEVRQEFKIYLSNEHPAAAVAAAADEEKKASAARVGAFYGSNPSAAASSSAAAAAAGPVSAQIYEPPISSNVRPQSEFDRWLAEDRIVLYGADSVHVLDWWRANNKRFPYLSNFAKRYLAVQTSAAPVERVWSSAGRPDARSRMALHPDTIADQVFLHENAAFLTK